MTHDIIDAIMSKKLHTVDEFTSLKDVINTFMDLDIRHLPVIKNNEIVGMIGKSDVSHYHPNFLPNLTASHVMKRNPEKLLSGTSVLEATDSLINERFHAYPVVNKNEELIGIVSTTDLLKYLKGILENRNSKISYLPETA